MVRLKMHQDGEGPWGYSEGGLALSKIPTERIALLKNSQNGYAKIEVRR
jgi:hypothetical protein